MKPNGENSSAVGQPDERLARWNATARAYDLRCVHELFEAQVERTPNQTAVVFEGRSLTYAEVNARANRLAHKLRALGVVPDQLVAVCLLRSLDLPTALLAILKAGGAYVPIDPEYPRDRIEFMVQNSGASVLLTSKDSAPNVPVAHTVMLDERELAGAGDASNPAPAATLNNLAYAIYTSGSTGKPKGALNAHDAVANRLLWQQEVQQLGPADRVMQKTPYTFDVSVWEFFLPLLAGAVLVVAKPGGHRDPTYITSLITSERITTLHFVPSMFRLFLEYAGADACKTLKHIVTSGEALTVGLVDLFRAKRIPGKLYNLYGPTEAAVDVSCWICPPTGPVPVVPIGKPIANTQLHILNEQLEPLPIGAEGELFIGGLAVGRGYLNRPELTQRAFLEDPFAKPKKGRLYRTGDIAKYQPDGNIEYLGRRDDQVKIRGFRIELGEIQAALESHPSVASCVVMARADAGQERRVVAYIVVRQGQTYSDAVLRSHVAARLPEYMVPSAFVKIDRIPLNTSGKVDRAALPEPPMDDAGEAAYEPPAGALEIALAQIWATQLGRPKVGRSANFFAELGGDSLHAARIMVRIQSELNIPADVVAIFDAPSVAELATYLAQNHAAEVAKLASAAAGGASNPPR